MAFLWFCFGVHSNAAQKINQLLSLSSTYDETISTQLYEFGPPPNDPPYITYQPAHWTQQLARIIHNEKELGN